MRVALHTTYAATKKESLGELVGRIRQGFLGAGLEVTIRFFFADSFIKKVSAVDRVLKRYPSMDRFLMTAAVVHGGAETRMFSNVETGEPASFETIQAIAEGVSRSYPFGNVSFHFYAPVFGEAFRGLPKRGNSLPGVLVIDNWWVKGRQRDLSVYTVVDVEHQASELPPHPKPVADVIKACGKTKATAVVPTLAPGGGLTISIPRENIEAVNRVAADYQARMEEVVAHANLPHDLPSASEALHENAGVLAGPRKPALESVFKPLGYDCRGGSGEFHLSRRTPGNLIIELWLDVGTWSHEVSASFVVQGAGFRLALPIPVTRQGNSGQYPIGDAVQWQKIVENLQAIVRELEIGFVPEVEAAAGLSPTWYQPAR